MPRLSIPIRVETHHDAMREPRPKAARTQLSDIACLMGLVAITVAFWTLVAFGLVLLF